MLTAAYPIALTTTNDDMFITPIHTILFHPNVDQLSEIVRFLVESNPLSLQVRDSFARVPLLVACSNGNMTTKIIQLLLDYWPESSRQLDDLGETAVHLLCNNLSIDDMTSLEITTLLIESYPDAMWLEDADCRQLPFMMQLEICCRSFSNCY